MDHSYANEDNENNDSVEGPADDDHNYISEKKVSEGNELEDDQSEEADNDKLVISLASPLSASKENEEETKVTEEIVDQNQNTSTLHNKEAESTEQDIESTSGPTKNGNKETTDKSSENGSPCKDDDSSKDNDNSAKVDEGEATKDGEAESHGDNSQLDDSQLDSSQLDSSQLDDSQNDSSLQNEDSAQADDDDGNESDSLDALVKEIPKYTVNLDMEMLTRPFKEGWKREVVQRKVFQEYSDSGKKKSKPIDIYYFTPEGKKLRSMIQITDYVNRSSSKLPLECFCFMRKPIYRPPFEIVRSAGKSRRPLDTYSRGGSSFTPKKGRGRGNRTNSKGNRMSPKGNRMSPKVSFKPSRPKPSEPEPEVVIERDEEEDMFVTPYLEMAFESTKKRSLDSDGRSSPMEPPGKKKATARKSTTPRIQQTIRQTNPLSEGQLCTITCPGLEGKAPDLQCCICMCLFHPRCVNVPDNNIPPIFNCLRCKSAQGRKEPMSSSTETSNNQYLRMPSVPGSSSTVTVVFPSKPIAASNGAVTPVIPSAPSSSISLNNTINTTLKTFLTNKSPPPLKNILNCDIPPLPPLKPANSTIPRNINPVSHPSSTAFTIPPPRLTAAPGTIGLPTSIPPLPPLTIPPVPGKLGLTPQTPVVVQKPSKETPVNAQLLTLPGAVTKRLNLSQPLALKINNVHIVVPPNCVINSKDGLKVVLPPNTFGLPVDPNAKLNVTVSNDSGGMVTFKTGTEPNTGNIDKGSSSKTVVSVNADSALDAVNENSKRQTGAGPASCYMKKLYGGFECMLSIFKYLATPDLLRAGQVCKTWHLLSNQPSLWRCVRLKDMKIPDWETATKYFRKVGVEKLSLKGLHHYDDRNRTWHLLMANLHDLVALREVQFGLVPAAVLHSVCEKLQSLEVFSAEFISDSNSEQMWNTPTKIDISKFSSLQHLRELRLRGVGGLVLPTLSSTNGLSQLTELSQLQVLSLTTLRSFQDSDFHFLSKMNKLKSLEIGDCLAWSKTYELLGTLTGLRRLRLECGGDLKNTDLSDALLQMKELEELELVMYIIPDSLSSVMEKLDKLHRFIVWPDTSEDEEEDEVVKSPAQVNTNTLSSLSKLKKLQYLEWGVINNSESGSPDSKLRIQFLPGHFDVESITIHQLTEKLCKLMPDTEKIRIFKTQPLNHTKYKNRET